MMKTTIEALDIFGQGIAHIDGKCYFLRGGLPGETVQFAVEREKKRYGYGRVTKVLTPSPERLMPPCPQVDNCGGCTFQQVTYEGETAAKQQHIVHALSPLAAADGVAIPPLKPAAQLFHYRNKATFHHRNGQIGFFAPASHRLTPVSRCLLLSEVLNRVLARLSALDLAGVTALTLRVHDGEAVSVDLRGALPEGTRQRLAGQLLRGEVATVHFENGALYGESRLTISLLDKAFSLSPTSFFQVNGAGAAVMFDYVCSQLPALPCAHLLDLYCGVGVAGQLLAGDTQTVYGLDVVPAAIADANFNAVRNGVTGHYICGKTEDKLKDWLRDIPPAQMVVVDPPRQGLAKGVAAALNLYGAPWLLYISCDVTTLARDLRLLVPAYRLLSLQSFDLFPRTAHLETVALLTRRCDN